MSKSVNSPSSGFLDLDRGKTKSGAIQIPSISLPKGGGAIKSIDEKFSVNAANGTAGISIPLPVSDARGFSPALNLTYNSGQGNSIFGLGWSLDLPSIKRKTEKNFLNITTRANQTFFFCQGPKILFRSSRRILPVIF